MLFCCGIHRADGTMVCCRWHYHCCVVAAVAVVVAVLVVDVVAVVVDFNRDGMVLL